MMSLPTGTVTFLFTDIEGSTALWQQFPSGMPDALARHHALLRQAIEAHHGYVFQIVGDAFCAAFATAGDGVQAALAAQRALHEAAWGETGPLHVRMALHTGQSELRAGEFTSGEYVSGPTLNRCARLLACGHGGQVLLSQAARDLVVEDLPQGVTLRDLGEHCLRDLVRPEQIFQLSVSDLSSAFPPLKTLDAFSHNLPIQLTSFIGREREIAEVKQLLDKARLLTLTGAGGTGKTRLALQIATDILDVERFPHGVWLVELAALTDPALVPPSIASVLGVREQQGYTQLDLLTDYLRTKQLLLILDNCEHLIQACAQFADTILRAASHVKILATSREALGITGECTYRVPSLQLPTLGNSTAVETLAQLESVRLFVDRATAAQPQFALSSKNVQTISQICRRLDGIPLAIELAAARVKALSVEQIAQRLDDRFRLLTGGSRTALPRQRTLRALIDWGYNLLDEGESLLFRRLAVFGDGCTLEAAEAICTGGGDLSTGVLDRMAALVDKSLLYQKEDTDGRPRFMMLETIREYAKEQLLASAEAHAVRDRHCMYYGEFLRHREGSLLKNQGVALREIETEIENVRAGWDWAAENAKVREIDAYLGSLAEFYRLRGQYREGERVFARAAERLRSIQQGNEQRDFPTLLGKVLLQEGRFLDFLGMVEQSRELWNAALALFSETGARRESAFALCCLGGCDGLYGGVVDSPQVRKACVEGLSLFQEIGDQRGIAFALRGLGWVAWNGGDSALAKQRFQESVDTYQQVGDQEGLIRSTSALGYATWILGDYGEAKKIHERTLTLCQAAGDQGGIARALGDLGIDAAGLREFGQSRQLFEQSLALYRKIGNPWGIADELGDLAEIALQTGEYETAVRYAQESLAVKAKVTRGFHSWELRILGMAACALGNFQAARKNLRESLGVAAASGQPWRLLYTMVGVSMLFVAQDAKERALELLTFVLHHRSAWQMIRDQAVPLFAKLKAELPPDVVAAAQLRGQARDLQGRVDDLLLELKEK